MNNLKAIEFVLKINDAHSPIRIGFVLTLFILWMAFYPVAAFAQSGSIIGKVTDRNTGEPLPGAKLTISEIGNTAIADSDGRYIFHRVQTGEYNLSADLLGYNAKNISISVEDGANIFQNIELTKGFLNGDKIFVNTFLRQQALTLESQHSSENFKSVISSEQMKRFADISVQDALIRVPGIQVGSRSDLNIRGTGSNFYNVTMDGQRMGTTGAGDRSFDFGTIPTDMIRKLEVIKVIRPDMDADAIGGNVNIITKRPAGGDRVIDVRLSGMSNTKYNDHLGTGSIASLNYAESPRDDFSIAVNFTHQLDHHGWESIGLSHNTVGINDEPVDVLQNVSPGIHLDERRRLGGGIQLTYQPSNRSTFQLHSMINNNNRIVNLHRESWTVGDEWIDESTPADGEGTYGYDLYRQDMDIQQYMIQATGKHLTNYLDIEYGLGWGYSNINQQYSEFPFEVSRLDFSVDKTNRKRPVIRLSDDSSPIKANDMRLQNMTRIRELHIDRNYSGRLDLSIPFNRGRFKFGTSTLMTYRDGNYGHDEFRILGITDMTQFDLKDRTFDILDQYQVSRTLDSHGARLFLDNNVPAFRKDKALTHERSDIWNHDAVEHVHAGYGMLTLNLGRFEMQGGVRMEFTDAEYDGQRAFFNPRGRYSETVDTSQAVDYNNLFPYAQAGYAPAENLKIRLAYSESIARPDFNIMAPFELVNAQDTTIFRGNPELQPVTSDNFDVLLDYYFMNIGHLGISLFYKEMSNFVVESHRTIEAREDDFDGFHDLYDEDTQVIPVSERTFRNDDKTQRVYGVELSWQQNLTFLPGLLSNLSTYVNYTWSGSEYTVNFREDEFALPGQSPHVVNIALQFTRDRFTGQTSFHWTAASLSELSETAELAPLINSTQPVYMDRYQDGWKDLTVSARYRITDSFRIWADAYNLLETERFQYEHTRDLYPRMIDYHGGRGIRLGIRYSY